MRSLRLVSLFCLLVFVAAATAGDERDLVAGGVILVESDQTRSYIVGDVIYHENLAAPAAGARRVMVIGP